MFINRCYDELNLSNPGLVKEIHGAYVEAGADCIETNTFGAIARVRNSICHSIHQFFQEEGFLYVHTPIITASDCEGAGEMFQVTTLDLGKLAGSGTTPNFSLDFFDRPSYLTVSGQLEAETFACALGKVYTFGPTFRAENSNTSRHLAEFWMVEPEMAFFDLDDNMDLAERFLKRIFQDVLDRCPEDVEFFNLRIDKTVIDGNLVVKTQCKVSNLTVTGDVIFEGNQGKLIDVDFHGQIIDRGESSATGKEDCGLPTDCPLKHRRCLEVALKFRYGFSSPMSIPNTASGAAFANTSARFRGSALSG